MCYVIPCLLSCILQSFGCKFLPIIDEVFPPTGVVSCVSIPRGQPSSQKETVLVFRSVGKGILHSALSFNLSSDCSILAYLFIPIRTALVICIDNAKAHYRNIRVLLVVFFFRPSSQSCYSYIHAIYSSPLRTY
jgi:hypothetical protein